MSVGTSRWVAVVCLVIGIAAVACKNLVVGSVIIACSLVVLAMCAWEEGR